MGTRQESRIRMDLEERSDAYVLRADLPGCHSNDIDISVADGVVTIGGRCEGGGVSGTFQLPGQVDSDRAEAHLDGGELTLTLPKATEGQHVTIHRHGQAEVMGEAPGAAPGGIAGGMPEAEKQTDPVELASDDSFPASDPPSHR